MTVATTPVEFIDEGDIITSLIQGGRADAVRVREVLAKAREAEGAGDGRRRRAGRRSATRSCWASCSTTARAVKETIYGRRLVLFAPLYVSNLCANECLYCAFRARNTRAQAARADAGGDRAARSQILVDQGHKRVLLVAGESYPQRGLPTTSSSPSTRSTASSSGRGEIRRVNVNVAPLDRRGVPRSSRPRGIGTYQLFQETYHRADLRARCTCAGKKRDYDWRVTAHGPRDGGRHRRRGHRRAVRPVRLALRDAGADAAHPPPGGALRRRAAHDQRAAPRAGHRLGRGRASRRTPVSDVDFRKIVAILRLAVPYTGIIMSTRETADTAARDLRAGRVADLGRQPHQPRRLRRGDDAKPTRASSSSATTAPLDEVIRDVAELGYIPSFCTACYRLGRTGRGLHGPGQAGEIKHHCDPNALSTLPGVPAGLRARRRRARRARRCIDAASWRDMDDARARRSPSSCWPDVRAGKRDVYC